jgi:hypothetical protein
MVKAPVASTTKCSGPAMDCASAALLASSVMSHPGWLWRETAKTSAQRGSACKAATKAAPIAPLAPSTTAR